MKSIAGKPPLEHTLSVFPRDAEEGLRKKSCDPWPAHRAHLVLAPWGRQNSAAKERPEATANQQSLRRDPPDWPFLVSTHVHPDGSADSVNDTLLCPVKCFGVGALSIPAFSCSGTHESAGSSKEGIRKEMGKASPRWLWHGM